MKTYRILYTFRERFELFIQAESEDAAQEEVEQMEDAEIRERGTCELSDIGITGIEEVR